MHPALKTQLADLLGIEAHHASRNGFVARSELAATVCMRARSASLGPAFLIGNSAMKSTNSGI
jgi:hypothetical protein